MNAPTKVDQAKVEQMPKPMESIAQGFGSMEDQLKTALPAHIPVERFVRVCMTAVQMSPYLLRAERKSLFLAAMKCAQDGLVPDGRDAALVPFKDGKKSRDENRSVWSVQYMPMIAGILKKVRNSGELKTISAQIVYENDKFFYRLGDDEKIDHEPLLEGDRGKPRLVYAVAHTKDGGVYREVMTIADVNKIRNVSKAKDDGPWVSWWEEMARKTAIRRLAKRLPMSTDLDDLIRRDDDLYDFDAAREAGNQATIAKPRAVKDALGVFAGDAPQLEHQDGAATAANEKPKAKPPADDDFEDSAEVYHDPETGELDETGVDEPAEQSGWPTDQVPAKPDEYREYAAAAIKVTTDADALIAWFKSEAERKLRNACGVTKEVFEEVQALAKAKATELRQKA